MTSFAWYNKHNAARQFLNYPARLYIQYDLCVACLVIFALIPRATRKM